MIFRDDDLSIATDLDLFKEVHNHFRNFFMMHTVALIVKDIEQHTELVEYIRTNNIDVQVHCWEHYDLTKNLEQLKIDLPKCIETIHRVFGQTPDTLFPPWNRSNDKVKEIAASFGLKVSKDKVSLEQYIRAEGDVKETVINFHSWFEGDRKLIETALEIYNSKRSEKV